MVPSSPASAHCAFRVVQIRPASSMLCRPQISQLCSNSSSVYTRAASSSSGSGKRSPRPPVGSNHKPKPLPFKSTPSPQTSQTSPSIQPTPAEPAGKANHGSGHGSSSSNGSGGSSPRKVSVSELVRTRWIALFGAGAAALCLGSFTASFVWLNLAPAPAYCTGHEPQVPTGRPAIQSPLEFDLHLDKSEHRYGITKLRRQLGAEARGHVLEVAVGTGRNLEFYDWDKLTQQFVTQGQRNKSLLEKSGWGGKGVKIEDVREMESFTGVDISESMLDIGLKRVRSVVPHGTEILPVQKQQQQPVFADLARLDARGQWCLSLLGGKMRILKGDAQEDLPLPSIPTTTTTTTTAATNEDQKYFDTVIQTFGLCSVRDPARLLENMAARVRPGTGRILLLEHGRSWWELVNGLLDRSAAGHFERFGCWWNRDIEAVVAEARARDPRIEVVEVRRPGWFKFGTHFWIELRVREEELGRSGKKEVVTKDKGVEETKWSSWWDLGSLVLAPKPKSAESGSTSSDGEKREKKD